MDEIRERFQRDYSPAFLRYLSQRSEPGLRAAYELGRSALAHRLSLLDLAQIHHTVVLDVLRTTRSEEELADVAAAAAEFFVELLTTFEMAQRGFAEIRRPAEEERPSQ